MDPTPVFTSGSLAIHKVVVGEMDNNVYFVVDREVRQGVMIDAAADPELLIKLATQFGVGEVVVTHGHGDHIGAVAGLRAAGLTVAMSPADADAIGGADRELLEGDLIAVGAHSLRTIETPGHTPGSLCFVDNRSDVLFSGDTLFPGGPGATHFPGGDFPTIVNSLTTKIFDHLGDGTIVLPGHGSSTTIGPERAQLKNWIERGW
jgi:glyoxylase-like metal-dependent hydrolase (beta-lactamase superfamily II)